MHLKCNDDKLIDNNIFVFKYQLLWGLKVFDTLEV